MRLLMFILTFTCMSMSYAQNTKTENIPEPIILFLSQYSINEVTEKAPKMKDPVRARETMTKDFMIYAIRPPHIGSDMFIHEICYNTISQEYWIYRTGGISGLVELFGPLKLKTMPPNQAPQTTTRTVTDRAPSSTLRASASRV